MTDTRKPLSRRVVDTLTRIELGFAGVMLLVILVLVFTQAAQRYTPFEGIAWTGEISRFGLAWMTFSVAGVLITLRGHIALEVVDTLPAPRLIRTVQVLSLLIVAVIAIGLTMEAWGLVQTQGALRSPVLGMSMALVYLPVLSGMVSTVIRSLVAAWMIAKHGPIMPTVDQTPAIVKDPS
ncbi:TRAP transporter small permease [Nesterenkonia sp. DZ6]|uniref:TRAP transporter small permease n=1 Tax=Nesterenkonia sp. DZ6 TaxID=2901229 RepID=UPI001F4D1DCA|nr:TRAP transporter small permease subunit [Nesterenkonia sp. DZ6]